MDFSSFTEYLQIEKNYSAHTIQAYTTDLKRFAEFIEEEFDEENIGQVNYSMIRSWIIALVDTGISNRSINRKISSLQSYYTYLLRTKQLEVSPLHKHKSLKEKKKVQVPFSQKEMEKAMNIPVEGFEEVRNKLIVELFYSTGIRRAELIAVQLADLTLQSDRLKIRGKGNKERLIPVLPSIKETLLQYIKERKKLKIIEDKDYLLLTLKGKKLYDMLVYRVVKEYFSAISSKSKISPHILRHSFATHLLNEGADINSIKNLLGHESLASTQVYTHNDIATLQKIHAKAHPRNNKLKD